MEIGMRMGGPNMMQTGLQSLVVLLLVQAVGGQDLAGVLTALQGQAGEVLVKGDAVGCLADFTWMTITLDRRLHKRTQILLNPTYPYPYITPSSPQRKSNNVTNELILCEV